MHIHTFIWLNQPNRNIFYYRFQNAIKQKEIKKLCNAWHTFAIIQTPSGIVRQLSFNKRFIVIPIRYNKYRWQSWTFVCIRRILSIHLGIITTYFAINISKGLYKKKNGPTKHLPKFSPRKKYFRQILQLKFRHSFL